MTRRLGVVDGADADVVLAALAAALDGSGPAVFPAAADAELAGLPDAVDPEIALVVQTSGSTGAPKRVALSAEALLASARGSAAAIGGSGQWLLTLPAHYIAGAQVLVRSLAAATHPVVMPAGHFDPVGFAAATESMADGPRFVSLVPTQLARIVTAARDDPRVRTAARSFSRILLGGQAAPAPLIGAAADLGLRVTRTYGSSETAGGCVYDGRPIGDTRIAVRDGAVELSGSSLAWGYLGDPERNASTFAERDGVRWYLTGDGGSLAADGTLSITGRLDNVIISGGEKVSLDALERLVRAMPGFGDAVVVAAPDPEWGEVPVVAVPGEWVPADLERLRARAADTLGRAARPARIARLDPLPQLASGKPDRRAIAAALSV